jgi:ligand-binding SRPBCC domain-containing protein
VSSIRLETVIAAAVEDCFALSLSVDAHTASMSRSGEVAIAGRTSGLMGLGDVVTWRARHFGVSFTMTSAITSYERPTRFVDEQRHGPFRRWWHEHTFQSIAPPRTLMIDTVHFRSPLGPIGAAVDRLLLTQYMTALIKQRNEWLKTELEGTT